MRPIQIRFVCFGPYVQEQCVDFEELEKSGLFLISGETGAGKTTILDAICYALYGRSSGGLRGDMSVMRCKLAPNNQETLTEFTFESGGKRYRFTRSLKYGRKNLNDFHNCMELKDGVYVPIFENPKATNVNKMAEEIIGLTYDQFRQVIILPQGQFERLLVSDSAEKEKILVSLFHADRWQRITDELSARITEQDNALKREKVQISAKLEAHSCINLEALREKAEQQSQQLEALEAQKSESQKTLLTFRETVEQATLENRDFQELAASESKLAQLKKKEAQMEIEAALLALSDKAEALHPQNQAYQSADLALQKAKKQTADAVRQQKTKASAVSKLEEARQKQQESLPIYHKMKEELILLENGREFYALLPDAQKQAEKTAAALKLVQKEAVDLEVQFQKVENDWLKAQRTQSETILAYQKAQASYLRNIGSVLARELVEGLPCPVCGSTVHPQPAEDSGEVVTQEQVEKLNRKMNEANDAVSLWLTRRNTADNKRLAAKQRLSTAEQEAAIAAQTLANLRQRCFAKIDTIEQLEQKIAFYQKQISGFEKALESWQQDYNRAQADLLSAVQQTEERQKAEAEAEEAFRDSQEQWISALAKAGFASEAEYRKADITPEEKQRRKTQLIQFRTALTAAQEEYDTRRITLEGRTAPNLTELKRKQLQLEQQYQNLSEQLVLGRRNLEALQRDSKQLEEQLERYNARRTQVDADLEFANRLRGRSGVSLQRYVLGVMLTAITVEANRLLSQVYGGRYRLFRTDAIAGSGRKGGLELEVYDNQNSQRRSVTTLSGGEKFLVALSLAIGLSTVVQAQGHGIRLEAMFIDEGFGSLDREAVADALEVLRGIQRASGTVGIISHVETLAEIIPTQLVVEKGKQGSRLRVVG